MANSQRPLIIAARRRVCLSEFWIFSQAVMQAAKTRTEASFRWSCAFWEGSLHGMGLSGFRPPVTLQEFKDLCIRSYIGSEACDAGRGIGGRSHARTFSAGSITARIESIGCTNDWPMVISSVRATGQAILRWRDFAGVTVGTVELPELPATIVIPHYVRLTRTGSSFQAEHSSDGTTWEPIGDSVAVSMGQQVYVGLAVSANVADAATLVGSNIVGAAPCPSLLRIQTFLSVDLRCGGVFDMLCIEACLLQVQRVIVRKGSLGVADGVRNSFSCLT